MLRVWVSIVSLVVLVAVGRPPATFADEPGVVSDTEAAAHVGQMATVQGLVADVYVSQKGDVFLNFENPYPNEVFSGVVFASSAGQFGDLTSYQGKQVQVTGVIRLYKGRPEIILQSPDQLRIAP